MDEFEREEIAEKELPEEALPEEETPEEVQPEEETLEEAEEENEEAIQEELPSPKPEKPIKGPRFWTWLVALLMMLFGLLLTIPAVWNLVLGIPAVIGLVNEAGGKYDTAASAYDLLYQTDMGAGSLGFSGLGMASGNFYYERQNAPTRKRDGPLAILQSETLPPISSTFPERVPRHLRELAAQCDALTVIYEKINAQLQTLLTSDEELDDSEWTQVLLTAIESTKAQDTNAAANAVYYETIALQNTTSDPAQKQANLDRIAALQKDKAGAFWMYEGAAFYYALKDEDYDTAAAICEARLKRNRQDYQSMQYRVKALNLSNGAQEAFKAADRYAKRAGAEDYMQLAKAEIYYRQGKYDDAIAICDDIIEKANLETSAATAAQQAAQSRAMEAADVKCIVLLLQGKTDEAVKLIETMQGNPYTTLTVYAAAGKWESEEAQNLIMMLSYYGYPIPQAITDLSEGKTNVEKIFTDGWGGFDV